MNAMCSKHVEVGGSEENVCSRENQKCLHHACALSMRNDVRQARGHGKGNNVVGKSG